MEYTLGELLFFFLIYSIGGWIVEVIFDTLKKGYFVNPGMFYGPISPKYGVAADLILILMTSMRRQYITVFIGSFVIINVVEILSGYILEITSKGRYRRNEIPVFKGWKGFCLTLLGCGFALLALEMLHPFAYLLYHITPALVMKIILGIGVGVCVVDAITSLYIVHRSGKEFQLMRNVSAEIQNAKMTLGYRIYSMFLKRLRKVFPESEADCDFEQIKAEAEKKTFAKDFSFYKIVWIFLICSLLGDWIETVYVFCVSGVLMSRSSLIYGTFSIVWGLGAVVLTLVLSPLAKKEDRYIFLGGFFIGGTYEYVCSVFTEIVFGKVFWDYSHMPLNIGGRTNVLFMFFWGILSVGWIKIAYPYLSKKIEQIPALTGVLLTWLLIIFMVLNSFLSAMALIRYNQRSQNDQPDNAIERFLDYNYPDETIQFIWPNMKEADNSIKVNETENNTNGK